MASDGPADPPPSDAEAVADDQPGNEYIWTGFMQDRRVKCKIKDCQKQGFKQHNWYCVKHSGIKRSRCADKPEHHKCKFKGCVKSKAVSIYCVDHARETVSRLRRDHELRAKWLPTFRLKQNLRCAAPVLTCLILNEGRPGGVLCPFKGGVVPEAMMELDHKVPLSQGGTDDRANLQALCACCHAMKSRMESRFK